MNIPIYSINYIQASDIIELTGCHWTEYYFALNIDTAYINLDLSKEHLNNLEKEMIRLKLNFPNVWIIKSIENEIELIKKLNTEGYNKSILMHIDN